MYINNKKKKEKYLRYLNITNEMKISHAILRKIFHIYIYVLQMNNSILKQIYTKISSMIEREISRLFNADFHPFSPSL